MAVTDGDWVVTDPRTRQSLRAVPEQKKRLACLGTHLSLMPRSGLPSCIREAKQRLRAAGAGGVDRRHLLELHLQVPFRLLNLLVLLQTVRNLLRSQVRACGLEKFAQEPPLCGRGLGTHSASRSRHAQRAPSCWETSRSRQSRTEQSRRLVLGLRWCVLLVFSEERCPDLDILRCSPPPKRPL